MLQAIEIPGRETPLGIPWRIGEQDAISDILVIEDDSSLANLEADVLTAHGYTVVSVADGESALSLLHQAIPDLVVLDLELLGDIDGWDVLHELRSFSSVPVLITSSSTTTARHYIRTSGETRSTLDHIAKPFPVDALLKHVQRMLPISPAQ